MAKVYSLESRGFVGKRCWLEVVGYDLIIGQDGEYEIGPKMHKLIECDVEFMPFLRNPAFRVTDATNRSSYIAMSAYGQHYVFWDEKPTEPYFKDGWPEWEVIGMEGSA